MKRLLNYSLIAVSLFSVSAVAQEDVQSLATKLHEQRIRAEENLAKGDQEAQTLEAQRIQLDTRLAEIAEQKIKTLNSIREDVTAAQLNRLMMEPGSLDQCKVTSGSFDGEFFITDRSGVSIRFHFAPEHSLKKPTAKLVKSDNLHLIEITQEGFSPADPNKAGSMKATLRIDDSFKVVFAVFTGEKIKDQFLGLSSSYSAWDMTCELTDTPL